MEFATQNSDRFVAITIACSPNATLYRRAMHIVRLPGGSGVSYYSRMPMTYTAARPSRRSTFTPMPICSALWSVGTAGAWPTYLSCAIRNEKDDGHAIAITTAAHYRRRDRHAGNVPVNPLVTMLWRAASCSAKSIGGDVHFVAHDPF